MIAWEPASWPVEEVLVRDGADLAFLHYLPPREKLIEWRGQDGAARRRWARLAGERWWWHTPDGSCEGSAKTSGEARRAAERAALGPGWRP